MLLGLAIAGWLIVALPSIILIRRYAYSSWAEVPFILVSPESAGGFYRILGYVLMFVPFLYLLATLGMVVAWWNERGWLWAAGSFLVASALYSRARSGAWKRAANEIYMRQTKEESPEKAAETVRIVMGTRQFWPPGRGGL